MDHARAELFRVAWGDIRGWREDNLANLPAAQRAIDAGAAPADVALAMSAAAYEAVFTLMFALDEGADPNGQPGRQLWALVDPSDGRRIAGLHEEVLMADPSGREGGDLFA